MSKSKHPLLDISSSSSPSQQPPLQPITTTSQQPTRKNVFILKSLTIILSLTVVVLVINYYLISNCPKVDQTNTLLTDSYLSSLREVSNSVDGGTSMKMDDRLVLSVYYEVLCPDSKHFVVNQLVPVFGKYGGGLVKVRFVPFGKGKVSKGFGGGYKFSCQHGQEECHGNKLHACISSKLNNDSLSLSIISCSMDRYRLWASTIDSITTTTRECIKKHAPDHNSETMMFCENGDELLAAHGYETLALRPSASFIPTIGVDGSLDNQRQILRDLDTVICDKLKKSRSINC